MEITSGRNRPVALFCACLILAIVTLFFLHVWGLQSPVYAAPQDPAFLPKEVAHQLKQEPGQTNLVLLLETKNTVAQQRSENLRFLIAQLQGVQADTTNQASRRIRKLASRINRNRLILKILPRQSTKIRARCLQKNKKWIRQLEGINPAEENRQKRVITINNIFYKEGEFKLAKTTAPLDIPEHITTFALSGTVDLAGQGNRKKQAYAREEVIFYIGRILNQQQKIERDQKTESHYAYYLISTGLTP